MVQIIPSTHRGDFPVQMSRTEYLLNKAKILISRLERISADSVWAHRSSGNRGALLRWIDRYEIQSIDELESPNNRSLDQLEALIESSYAMLEQAAKEIIR